MSKTLFSELNLTEKVERAITLMGFEHATPIQSEAIPVIRTGADVIAKSQTGTGKTVAFAIPAIEKIDPNETGIQVLILCPTRELAQQAEQEIQKIARFDSAINSVAIYGGAPIEKQCIRLRRANMVIGTPGRVMDHMRRKTIKLQNLKMIILDEADEMLNMGFKEDIETILTDTPETRQTVLFSATMPPAIMKLAKEFQHDVELVEIDKNQVVIGKVEQSYIDVPHPQKMDALNLLLQYHQPTRAIIFSNTKRMADELTEKLKEDGFSAESLHSDVKQSQRTKIMQAFKLGKISILVATDIAARGIDVSDIDYVINYDLPQNTEYYIHRIGRTGRAGKSGESITICSNRREIYLMRGIAKAVKTEIKQMELPSQDHIQENSANKVIDRMEKLLQKELFPEFEKIVNALVEKGYSLQKIAEAALQLNCTEKGLGADKIPAIKQKREETGEDRQRAPRIKAYGQRSKAIVLNVGKNAKVAPNHIVGAITERTGLSGADIGKISVSFEQTIVDVPEDRIDDVVAAMEGCKICGVATKTIALAEKPRSNKGFGQKKSFGGYGKSRSGGAPYQKRRAPYGKK